jgi:7-cyano-7-deazaguanine synthase in queuosine biosynthesis
MSDVMDSADLKESLFYLHWMASAEKGCVAIVLGADSEDISDLAPEIHKAMQRIAQLATLK